jgi:broad specificity phosphatase PhoE
VARRCGLPVAFTNALWEVDVGQLDGCSVDEEGLSAFRGVIREWEEGSLDASLPGGETLASARHRFGRFLDGLSDEPEGPLLIVGHGVLFMVVLWEFCKNPQPRMMDNYMGRGHLSVLSGRDHRYQLVEFNLAPGEATGCVAARP